MSWKRPIVQARPVWPAEIEVGQGYTSTKVVCGPMVVMGKSKSVGHKHTPTAAHISGQEAVL
jgi:hypothetical protein